MKKALTLCFLLSTTLFVSAQIDTAALVGKFRAHIEYLADDKLEGRETGTPGEQLAADYISAEFKKIGLKPLGAEGSYFQPFDFLSGVEYDNTKVAIKGKELGEEDFYFLPVSGSGKVEGNIAYVGYGIHAPDVNHDDYEGQDDLEGKIVIIKLGSPKGTDPHSEFAAHLPLRTKARVAKEFGAAGVMFVNHSEDIKNPSARLTQKITPADIPVVMLSDGKETYNDKYCAELAGEKAIIEVDRKEIRREGKNVIGFLDNGADKTIVVGGHYDHLGYGHGGGSLHRGEDAIHNGADDNASGIGMTIELARAIKEAKGKYNYLFIAFSGEEMGLLGSNYFVKNPTLEIPKMNCMINFDMVGRLDEEENKVGINGVGTSPFWPMTIAAMDTQNFKGILKTKTSESGVGPSDHTSFYYKNIPVLHFFSGTHSDYHKPSDDAEKINYDGMIRIYSYVAELLRRIEKSDDLAFTETKAKEDRKVPRWKVSLGVIPDYMFEGKGMRIDGVTEGKPAAKGGLKEGDIVQKLGDVDVTDIYSYMEALSVINKGDKVKVVVLRGKKNVSKNLQF